MAVFKFWKMHGAGNDFIVMPDLERKFPFSAGAGIRNLCRRPGGIGSEGLILLQAAGPSEPNGVLRMRFFNPDGQEASMCGNGARCAARLAADLGLTGKRLTLVTGAGRVRAECLPDGTVRIGLPPPSGWRLRSRLRVGRQTLVCHCVNTGVPHAVVPVSDLARTDVRKLGAAIRHHPRFAPQGTNVDFMAVSGAGTAKALRVRTYERGVEDETGACGTGMVACALLAGRLRLVQPPVAVICAHGDRLTVNYRLTARGASMVALTGPAVYVFEGRVSI